MSISYVGYEEKARLTLSHLARLDDLAAFVGTEDAKKDAHESKVKFIALMLRNEVALGPVLNEETK